MQDERMEIATGECYRLPNFNKKCPFLRENHCELYGDILCISKKLCNLKEIRLILDYSKEPDFTNDVIYNLTTALKFMTKEKVTEILKGL